MLEVESILLNSFVEYLRSLLGMVEQNFTYESVFRYLRTGLVGFDDNEIDLLENYVVALGIRGYSKWQEKWIRRLPDMKEEHLEQLNHIRVQFVEKVDSFVFVLKQKVIESCPNYAITDDGKVWSFKSNKFLKQKIDK